MDDGDKEPKVGRWPAATTKERSTEGSVGRSGRIGRGMDAVLIVSCGTSAGLESGSISKHGLACRTDSTVTTHIEPNGSNEIRLTRSAIGGHRHDSRSARSVDLWAFGFRH